MQKIKVYEILEKTAGGQHIIYRTDYGNIRKPIGERANLELLDKLDFSELGKKTVRLESELQNWGRWLNNCTTGGMGYPSQATLVTALQGSRSTTTPNLPINEEAERVDGFVRQLGIYSKVWEIVLRRHYTRELNQSVKSVYLALDMSEQTYMSRLRRAKQELKKMLRNG